ncbi:MAG: amino acid ABC transporter permease [Desulfitobacteriaceae bacterium]|nr:amino acid ABC transporter permease [Desulfitobacteriaceae bacterium]MDD4752860.1 amino acid ABC transporter permease [Desulfitobacteriaceae bacterium]
MPYDFSIIIKEFPVFIPAAILTLELALSSILLGTGIGLFVSFARISKSKVFNIPASIYITIIRGTPILLQLFIIYYGITSLLLIDPFPAAVIAFGVHNGAYIAEIFRGAIQSIDKGQMEAARSLGMTYPKAMRRIILPQAIKRALPALGNQFIITIKDTSLASAITIRELLLKSQQLGSSNFRFMEYFIIAGIYYLTFTATFSYLVHKVESYLAVSDH